MSLVSEQLLGEGLKVYITSKYGTIKKSILQIERKDANVEPKLVWGNGKFSTEFSFISSITGPLRASEKYSRINIHFTDFELLIELTEDIAQEAFHILTEMHKKAVYIRNLERDYQLSKASNHLVTTYPQTMALKASLCKTACQEEGLQQFITHMKYKEGYMLLEKNILNLNRRRLTNSVQQWVRAVRDENDRKMVADRERWRLHATSNLEIDLQAWYHALFYKEVYRLRGYFWYKDAVLPSYRASYDLVDNALTALEEAALAHILCSPDTTYGDVAGQMFVVQNLLSPELFTLFNKLATEGQQITKYPRQGRPAKKLFRFSFVEGNIYLTWKGKFGNQGVGISEVTDVLPGMQTDILKWWAASSSKPELYLSIICADRSIDLMFDSVKDRDAWFEVLNALMKKERNDLVSFHVEPVESTIESDFDAMVLYSSINKDLQALQIA